MPKACFLEPQKTNNGDVSLTWIWKKARGKKCMIILVGESSFLNIIKVGCLSHPHITAKLPHLFALHTMFHPINSPRVENAVRCWGVKGEMPSFLILAPSSFYEISQTVRTRPSSFSTDGLLMMVVSRDVAVTA
jgi:hypothetical protein